MTPLLSARALVLAGRLESTDLAVESGQLVCLVGPNGSGKTSLLHALSGIGGGGGTVRIDGRDPHAVAPAERRRLFAYLPASRDILWPLTARDVAGLGHDGEPAAIDRVFEELELAALADRRVDRLSTGERSRVLLARALAAQPKLLLLDEPVAGMNLEETEDMARYLVEVREELGLAMIMVEHHMALVMDLADRVLALDFGSALTVGTPDEVQADPRVAEAYLGGAVA